MARKERIKGRRSPQLTVHSRQLKEQEGRKRFNTESTEETQRPQRRRGEWPLEAPLLARGKRGKRVARKRTGLKPGHYKNAEEEPRQRQERAVASDEWRVARKRSRQGRVRPVSKDEASFRGLPTRRGCKNRRTRDIDEQKSNQEKIKAHPYGGRGARI